MIRGTGWWAGDLLGDKLPGGVVGSRDMVERGSREVNAVGNVEAGRTSLLPLRLEADAPLLSRGGGREATGDRRR